MPFDPFVLDLRGRELNCHPGATHVMGILNVTPDSFSDGGDFLDLAQALARAVEMTREGAGLIDVGGASSRPRGSVYGDGAEVVSASVELDRILPVIRAIARELPDTIISVDTYREEVASAALHAGAHIINDITALRHSPRIAKLTADAGAGLVLMHSRGLVGDMPHDGTYQNVVAEVTQELTAAAKTAFDVGVRSILLDPGFGFGKSVEDNFRLIDRIDLLTAQGFPVLVGVSRKSSIGAAVGSNEEPAPVDQRLFGSLGATAVAVMRGASLVRTHDVRATAEMLRVLERSAGTQA